MLIVFFFPFPQILEVNQQSFEHGMTLTRAVEFLMKSTHLEICVKSNLLGMLCLKI